MKDSVEVTIPDVVILSSEITKSKTGDTFTKVKYRSHDLKEHTAIDRNNTAWIDGAEGELVFKWTFGFDRNNKPYDNMMLVDFVPYETE